MVSTNTSAPLLQVEGETQLPPTVLETTIVKVEVIDTGENENSVNGGGKSGDVDSEVTVWRKRGRPRKHPVESRECLPSLQNLVPKRGRGRPSGTGKLQLLAAMEYRTSRVAPNGRNKQRRVSTNQTVINSDVYMNLEVSSGSMVIVEIFFILALLSRCAEYLFSNSDIVSEYVLSSCCKEIIAVKTGIDGAVVM
ncbi:hypothetical protein RHGRI_000388 [Rhododendron griersonianum]|uniref:AT-hook motif nuclear-localized protein n=1 Tax=Rhododendron griersonianum TaxID=479676 RepID=A0AAV6LGC9_9ERIC|nr:hypothetical protein RHGRI_000388 [Rhododendron griersonianum]